MNIAGEVAELLLSSEAIILRPNQPFKFSSGILSPIYCDNRLLLSKVSERQRIVDYYIKKIQEEGIEVEVIAGIATASIPWAALIAAKLKKPMVYIRKAVKDHGRENMIEGGLKQGQSVLVVEDLISTGKTSLSSVEAARKEGAVVEKCLGIFTYEMDIAKRGFEEANCRLVTLSNFTTLVEVAAKKGYIKEEDIKVLQEWSNKPEEWGR